MVGSCWEWLGVVRNGWEWLGVVGSGWEWLGIVGSGWALLGISGSGGEVVGDVVDVEGRTEGVGAAYGEAVVVAAVVADMEGDVPDAVGAGIDMDVHVGNLLHRGLTIRLCIGGDGDGHGAGHGDGGGGGAVARMGGTDDDGTAGLHGFLTDEMGRLGIEDERCGDAVDGGGDGGVGKGDIDAVFGDGFQEEDAARDGHVKGLAGCGDAADDHQAVLVGAVIGNLFLAGSEEKEREEEENCVFTKANRASRYEPFAALSTNRPYGATGGCLLSEAGLRGMTAVID